MEKEEQDELLLAINQKLDKIVHEFLDVHRKKIEDTIHKINMMTDNHLANIRRRSKKERDDAGYNLQTLQKVSSFSSLIAHNSELVEELTRRVYDLTQEIKYKS